MGLHHSSGSRTIGCVLLTFLSFHFSTLAMTWNVVNDTLQSSDAEFYKVPNLTDAAPSPSSSPNSSNVIAGGVLDKDLDSEVWDKTTELNATDGQNRTANSTGDNTHSEVLKINNSSPGSFFKNRTDVLSGVNLNITSSLINATLDSTAQGWGDRRNKTGITPEGGEAELNPWDKMQDNKTLGNESRVPEEEESAPEGFFVVGSRGNGTAKGFFWETKENEQWEGRASESNVTEAGRIPTGVDGSDLQDVSNGEQPQNSTGDSSPKFLTTNTASPRGQAENHETPQTTTSAFQQTQPGATSASTASQHRGPSAGSTGKPSSDSANNGKILGPDHVPTHGEPLPNEPFLSAKKDDGYGGEGPTRADATTGTGMLDEWGDIGRETDRDQPEIENYESTVKGRQPRPSTSKPRGFWSGYRPHPIHGLIWEDKDYMLSVLVPIGCGIMGALAIVCAAYAMRNCRVRRRDRPAPCSPSPSRRLPGKLDQVFLLADSSDDDD